VGEQGAIALLHWSGNQQVGGILAV